MGNNNTYMITSERSDGVTNTLYVSPEIFEALRAFGTVSQDELDKDCELYVLTLSEYALKLAYNEE